jgi:broad specificity phosphatase PhoE
MGNKPYGIEVSFDLCAKALYEEEPFSEREARAEEEIRQHLRKIMPSMNYQCIVLIFSSPVARAIHTAKVIREELLLNGFSVSDIKIEDMIGEVHNFSWNLFEPLMSGGTIIHEGQSFEVNKEDTNPKGLGYPDFFISDDVHQIPQSVTNGWPSEFVSHLKSFEKFSSVTERSLRFLRASAPPQVTAGHTIFVGHDANAMYLADKFTGGRQKGLVPGTSISLEFDSEEHLVVTRVGDITDGDSTTDFFQEFFGR